MANVITSQWIKGPMRRIESVITSEPFLAALNRLSESPDESRQALRDGKMYFESFGAFIPAGFDVTVQMEDSSKQASKGLVHLMICYTWMDEEGVHTMCWQIHIVIPGILPIP